MSLTVLTIKRACDISWKRLLKVTATALRFNVNGFASESTSEPQLHFDFNGNELSVDLVLMKTLGGQKFQFLVVDDEPTVRRAIAMLL